jgi:SAM-dependent methyltransferase
VRGRLNIARGLWDASEPVAEPTARSAPTTWRAPAHGFPSPAFFGLYRAAVEGNQQAGFRLARILVALRPTHALPELDEALRLALRAPWARPASLSHAITDYLLLDERVARVVEEASPCSNDLDTAVEVLASNELFAALLQASVVCDLRMERLSIALRDHLLAIAPCRPGALRLAALIATQANLAEYLWPYATGPIEIPAGRRGMTSLTSARALLNSMFRAPSASEVNAIEAIAADPAVSYLLERLRDELALRTRRRDELEQMAVSLGTAPAGRHDAPRSCPRWFKEPFAPRRLPPAVLDRLRALRKPRIEVLVAGCGSGQDLFSLCATHPDAHVTAFDPNAEKLAHAARRCEEAGLHRIDFVPGGLLDVAPLGWTFDVIECLGMERPVPDADFGCEALARCSRPGSLLRLAVYGEATCRVVSALRNAAQVRGITRWLADLRFFRAELLDGWHGALPPALLRSPEFFTASGLRDLLFADGPGTFGTSAWRSMLELHGFDFICEETERAGSPRFERDDAFAFRGDRFLWFERRSAATLAN